MTGGQRFHVLTALLRKVVIVAVVFTVCVWICFCARIAASGSCAKAKLCCSGRDSSCVVQGTLSNTFAEDVSDKPCYCDHACIKLGDCCADFKKACNVVDCLVSVWLKWSECDTSCGTGTMRRTRTVLKNPINGGRHCPPLMQKRACLGTNCPQNPRNALKEIAMLLPLPALSTTVATLTSANTIRPTHVTFDRAHTNNRTYTFQQISTFDNDSSEKLQLVLKKENNDEEYCVLFEIVKATVACTKESPFSNLREGEKVCVQCDREAMRPSLGYRCSGHGTMDRSTRWSALSAPHCHGKWKRLDASKSSCRLCVNGPHYVFV